MTLNFIRLILAAALWTVSTFGFSTVRAAEHSETPRQETVRCEGVDGDIRFEIRLDLPSVNVSPKALAMLVSDPNVSNEHSEIATFLFDDGVLNNTNGVVIGYIDPANPRTSRKGERIGGTRLGQLRSIMVDLDIDFTTEAAPRAKYSAQAVYLKKIGEELVQDLDCTREK